MHFPNACVLSITPNDKRPHGRDTLVGDEGNDLLTAGDDGNELFGGLDSDSLTGGADNDILLGDNGYFDYEADGDLSTLDVVATPDSDSDLGGQDTIADALR